MKRNLIVGLASLFSILFLAYIFRLASEISQAEKKIYESSDVVDVTDVIRTQYAISKDELAPQSGWKEIKLPGSIQADGNYRTGSFAHYRIFVPVSSQTTVSHLKGQLALSLGHVGYSQVDFFVNGKFIRSNTPRDTNEGLTIVPIEDGVDNLVTLRGKIGEGDLGLDHRLRILLGKNARLNELYTLTYKSVTVFPQIFILSKGSVLFLFTLIFLVISVSPFFDKFLLFGFCTLSSDFITGDALVGILTLSQMTFLYTALNAGAVIALFLFLSDASRKSIKRQHLLIGFFVLIAFGISVDVLFTHFLMNFTLLLKFWNLAQAIVLAVMIPSFVRSNRVLVLGIVISLVLTLWSSLFASNVGFNYKVFGDLILFFAVAAETFFLLRKEQDQLREQEKDVAIGRTAAILAHDVRRPLEQMRMVLDRISSGKSTPEFLEAARRDVEFSLTSVNTQVNDIINFSSVRTIDLVPVSFYRLLSASLKQVMTINQNVKVNLKYDLNGHVKVSGDESLLAGVMTNLISNAVEAIRDIGNKESGTITFTTQLEGDRFLFSVTNDGPPIPADVLPEIWKPLFTRGKKKGTGLGLSSVARALNDHGGSFGVANTDKGVTFTISLKASSEKDQARGDFLSTSSEYGYSAKSISVENRLRVFILDDDSQVFEYFRFLSDSVDFTFISSYAEAEKEVSAKRFDLYIIDYDLGASHTGADFIEQYLPSLKNVILHTNRESVSREGQAMQIAKPMSVDVFGRLLNDSVTKEKILLVDDSELVREAWTHFHGGHNLMAVSSPEEALRMIEKEKFEFFILDYYFDNSRMNGLELARRIQEKKSSGTIYLSSNVTIPSDEFPVIAKNQFSVVPRNI